VAHSLSEFQKQPISHCLRLKVQSAPTRLQAVFIRLDPAVLSEELRANPLKYRLQANAEFENSLVQRLRHQLRSLQVSRRRRQLAT